MNIRTVYRGTIEYIVVDVDSNFPLTSQPVYFSFDRSTWIVGEWTGDPGYQRQARMLLNPDNTPAESSDIFVRVTDDPEAPISNAGRLRVR